MPQQVGGAGGSDTSDKGYKSPRRGVPRPSGGGGQPASGGGGGGSAPTGSSSTQQYPRTTYTPPTPTPQSPRQVGARKGSGYGDQTLREGRIARKIRQLRESAGYTPLTERYGSGSEGMQERIEDIDKTSGGKIPPDIVVALAQIDLYKNDLQEVATTLARRFDPPKKLYLEGNRVKTGDPKEPWAYVDPFTGGPISARDAKYYFPVYEQSFWLRFLQSTPDNSTEVSDSSRGPGRAGRVVSSREPIDPLWVGAGFGVISKLVGKELNFKQAISVAVSVAQREVNTTLMEENLKHYLKIFPVKKALAAAQYAAEVNRQVTSPDEAMNFYNEVNNKDLALPEEIKEHIDRQKEINPDFDVQEAVKAQYGVDITAEEADQIQNTGSVRAAVKLTEETYDDYMANVMDKMYDKQDAPIDAYNWWGVGWLIHGASAAYSAWDRSVNDPIRRLAGDFMNEANYTFMKLKGGEEADEQAREWHEAAVEAANTIGHEKGEQNFGDFLQETHGFDPAQAMLFDLALTWYSDPLIVGGKVMKAARTGAMVQNSGFWRFASNFGGDYGKFASWYTTGLKNPLLGGRTLARAVGDEAVKAAEHLGVNPHIAKVLAAAKEGSGKTRFIMKNINKERIHPGALDEATFKKTYEETKGIIDAGTESAAKYGTDLEGEVGEDVVLLWDKLTGKGKFKADANNVDELFLAQKMDLGAGESRFFGGIDSMIKSRWKGQRMDPRMTDWIFNYVKTFHKDLSREELQQHIDELFEVAVGHKAAPNTAAAQFMQDYAAAVANKPMPSGKASISLQDADDIRKLNNAHAANDLLDTMVSWGAGHGTGNTLHAIPKAKLMGSLGRAWDKAAGDTAFSRSFGALRTKYSNPYLNLESTLPDDVSGILRRSREFTPGEVAYWRREAIRISRPGNANREDDFRQLANDIQKLMFQRIGRKMGLKDEISEGLFNSFQGKLLTKRKTKVDVGGETQFGSSAEQRSVMWETQLQNRFLLTDPVAIRQMFHSYVSSVDLMKNASRRIFGKDPLPLGLDELHLSKGARRARFDDSGEILNISKTGRAQAGKLAKDIIDGFYKFWKPLAVVSPRYVGRVVLGEETARYVADVGIIGRMKSGGTYNKLMEKLVGNKFRPSITYEIAAGASTRVGDQAMSAGFKSIEEARDAVQAAAKLDKMGGTPDPRIGNLSDEVKYILANAEIADDTKLTMTLYKPRPGAILDDDIVNPGLGRSEFFETFQREHAAEVKAIMNGKYGWGTVTEDDKGFLDVWQHHLNNTMGRSVVARHVMEHLYRGGDLASAKRSLASFLRSKEGIKYAERMGMKLDNSATSKSLFSLAVNEKVDEIAYITLYNKSDNDLLRLAMDGQVTDKYLAQFANDNALKGALPRLNGYKVRGAAGEETGVLTRMWDTYYKSIMQKPTNRISRQPFFKKHYTDLRWAMLKQAKDNGIEITDDLRRGINAEARQYAAQRVKDVMFDFQEQSRFAEMLHYVAPFAQPFFEQYTVWGKLLLDNPAIAGALNKVYDKAVENEVIEKDPLTGAWQFSASAFPFARIFNAVLPSVGGQLSGYNLMGNLASVNMFASNVFDLELSNLNESMPDVPLPLPGFNPPVMFAIQGLHDSPLVPEWMKPSVAEWAFQYGQMDVTDMVPAWMRDGAMALQTKMGWDFYGEDVIKSLTNEFIKEAYVRAGGGDEEGLIQNLVAAKGFTHQEAKDYIVAEAQRNAEMYFWLKAGTRLFMPFSFQIEGPLQELSDEQREYFEQYDYETAIKKFKKSHPELGDPALAALTMSESYWAGAPGANQDQTMLAESGAVPLPANQAVMELMKDPQFIEYIQHNPSLAFVMLPDEVWTEDFDRRAYFEQLQQGWRLPKDSYDFLDDIDEQLYLDQRIKLQQMFYKNRDMMTNAGVSWDSPTGVLGYKGGMGSKEFNEQMDLLNQMYEGASVRIEQEEMMGIDAGTKGILYEMLENPAARKTELGRAAYEYIQGANEIIEDMYNNNIWSINSSRAEEFNISGRAFDLKEEILEKYPSFSRIDDIFFNDYFTDVDVRSDRLGEIVETMPAGTEDVINKFDMRFGKAFNASQDAIDDPDAQTQYMKMRKLSYAAVYEDEINTQELWRKFILGPAGEKEYKLAARTRPFSFLSVFDRKLLGVPTNKGAEQRWLQLGQLDLEIARIRDANPNADTQALYDQRDAYVRQFAKTNKVFANQVKQANTWGFSFFHENPWVNDETDAGRSWSAFQESIKGIQSEVDRLEITGMHDFDDNKKAIYSEIKNDMESYVKDTLFSYSPLFQRQWKALDGAYGGKLIDYFIPEWYFPLGGSR